MGSYYLSCSVDFRGRYKQGWKHCLIFHSSCLNRYSSCFNQKSILYVLYTHTHTHNRYISWKNAWLKLKLQYLGYLMWRTGSPEKTLMLGKTEGRSGQQRMRWLDGITDSMVMSLNRLWESVMEREVWHVAIHGVTKSWTWLSNWTELNINSLP